MRMDKIIIDQTGIKQQVINEICELAQKYNVEQVLLFGSRSRGDYKRTSDIDLAVRGGDIDRFALDVEEETTTLLEYDIVDLDEPMQPELLESIQKEGKIIIIESTYLDRNVTHSYNQNIALSIISQAKEKFYDMFCLLKKEIDENWI